MFWAKKIITNCERTKSLLLFLPEIFKKNLKFLSPVLNQTASQFEPASIPYAPESVPHEPQSVPQYIYGMPTISCGTLTGSHGKLASSKWDPTWFSTGLRNLRFFFNISGRKRSRDPFTDGPRFFCP